MAEDRRLGIDFWYRVLNVEQMGGGMTFNRLRVHGQRIGEIPAPDVHGQP